MFAQHFQVAFFEGCWRLFFHCVEYLVLTQSKKEPVEAEAVYKKATKACPHEIDLWLCYVDLTLNKVAPHLTSRAFSFQPQMFLSAHIKPGQLFSCQSSKYSRDGQGKKPEECTFVAQGNSSRSGSHCSFYSFNLFFFSLAFSIGAWQQNSGPAAPSKSVARVPFSWYFMGVCNSIGRASFKKGDVFKKK
jgi:hypothetical protein